MNKLLATILVTFYCLTSISQTKEEAFRDAKKTAEATLKLDFKTVISHTYPAVVTIMGGKEKARVFIEKTFENMKKQGFKFEKADVISVSEIVKEQNEYRCFVQVNNQMVVGGQRVNTESYLLGIYNDSGKFWYFIEAKQLENPAISKVLHNFKTGLVIPQGKINTEKI